MSVCLDTAEENGGEAAEDFLPMDDNNMEVEATEEHVDRQQVWHRNSAIVSCVSLMVAPQCSAPPVFFSPGSE